MGRVATVIVAASQEQTITTQAHREITKAVMTSGSLICVCVHAPVQSPIAEVRYSFRCLCRWFLLHSSRTPVSPSHQGETPSRLQRQWQFRAILILYSSKEKSCSQNLSPLSPMFLCFMPQPAMWTLWPLLHYQNTSTDGLGFGFGNLTILDRDRSRRISQSSFQVNSREYLLSRSKLHTTSLNSR